MLSLESRHNHGGGAEIQGKAPGIPGLFHMQRIFWAFVGSAIAVAMLANLLNVILYHHRISTLRSTPSPAKPKSLLFKTHASLSAIIREFSYYSLPLSVRNRHFYLPPVGPITLMVAYIVLIVVCTLYRFNPDNFLEWESIGYRAGYIAICQLPLIVALAGKRNIIGFFTGVGYERLNWLHRWAARSLLFTVLIHIGYWFRIWGRYDYILVKLQTDSITQKGVAAGSILAWLVVSSVAPIRGLSYEIFVVQHIISWVGLVVALYLHVPPENQIWIWIPLAFWGFDRVVRSGYIVYTNLSFLHRNSTGFLACRATFETLGESHTRISIANPPITWEAGQHMFLACHPLAPLSSHPFTIASLPQDGKMEFVVRAKKGATKRFFKYAEKVYPSLPSSSSGANIGRSVLIDGPFARIRPLRQFDSLVFVAGSTGATFTIPLLRDIVRQWMGGDSERCRKFSLQAPAGAVTRHIRFIWIVKRTSSIKWFASQLDNVVADVASLRIEGHDVAVDISIYCTCDEILTSGNSSIKEAESETPGGSHSAGAEFADEKKVTAQSAVEVISPRKSSSKDCCCCTQVITDEDSPTVPCNCGSQKNNRISGTSSSSSVSLEKSSRSIIDSRIPLLSGRPNIPVIIRKTAEMALGEMAVVVCGPPGLVQCTRNAVVSISDDRAVHKGTDAQGIYVHAETFGYA